MKENEEVEDLMGYGKMVEKSLKSVVRETLTKVQKHGLLGEHHFYITFNTKADGVVISKALKAKYPEEMTIVLQHQYHNLHVEASFFSVALSFNGVNEKLKVPFNSICVFADPYVNFVLQFQHVAEDESEEIMGDLDIVKESLIDEDNSKPADIVKVDFKKKK